MLQRPSPRRTTTRLSDRAIPSRADVGPARQQGVSPRAFLLFYYPVHSRHLVCTGQGRERLATSGDILHIFPVRLVLAFALRCLTLGTLHTHSCFFFCNSPVLSRLPVSTISNAFALALMRPVSHMPLAAARPISTLSLFLPLPFHSHVPSHTLSPSLLLFFSDSPSVSPPPSCISTFRPPSCPRSSLPLSVSLALSPSLPSSYSVSISLLVE